MLSRVTNRDVADAGTAAVVTARESGALERRKKARKAAIGLPGSSPSVSDRES
jgi:hypothetical protein